MLRIIPRIENKVFGAVIAFSFLLGYAVQSNKVRHEVIGDSRKIDNVVYESLDYVSSLGTYLGKKISDNNKYKNLRYIRNLFRQTMSLQGPVDSVLSWSMFSWGDENNDLVVNTISGISKRPESLTERHYIWSARYEPWKLQFSKPNYGIVTKSWMIPVGIGVTNIKDEYKGTVITGINFKKIISRTESALNSGNAFVIASRDTVSGTDQNNLVFLSSNSPKSSKGYLEIPQIVKTLKYYSNESGPLPKSFTAGRYKFSYFKIIDDHSLVILVGHNRIDFWLGVIAIGIKSSIIITALAFLSTRTRIYKKRRKKS